MGIQQGRRCSHRRRRTLWGTLRMVAIRERSWAPFSASCYASALRPFIANNPDGRHCKNRMTKTRMSTLP